MNSTKNCVRAAALLTRPAANAKTVAKTLNVSVPTVRRYLNTLRSLGMVIKYNPGERCFCISDWGVLNKSETIIYASTTW